MIYKEIFSLTSRSGCFVVSMGPGAALIGATRALAAPLADCTANPGAAVVPLIIAIGAAPAGKAFWFWDRFSQAQAATQEAGAFQA